MRQKSGGRKKKKQQKKKKKSRQGHRGSRQRTGCPNNSKYCSAGYYFQKDLLKRLKYKNNKIFIDNKGISCLICDCATRAVQCVHCTQRVGPIFVHTTHLCPSHDLDPNVLQLLSYCIGYHPIKVTQNLASMYTIHANNTYIGPSIIL